MRDWIILLEATLQMGKSLILGCGLVILSAWALDALTERVCPKANHCFWKWLERVFR